MFPIEAGELLLEIPISLKEIFPIEAGDEEALLDCFDTVFFFKSAIVGDFLNFRSFFPAPLLRVLFSLTFFFNFLLVLTIY